MAEFIYFAGANNNCSKYSANKISKSRILFTAFLFCVFFFGNAKVYSQSGGNGLVGTPYQIANSTDWDWFVNGGFNQPSARSNFELTDNLGSFATPVTQMLDNCFSGNLDGGGFTIIVNITGQSYVGLFACLQNATVTNLEVKGSIDGEWRVGSVAGYAESSIISNIDNYATITGTIYSVGGIVGYMDGFGGEVSNCNNYGAVSGNFAVGGIVGGAANTNGEIIFCTNNSPVTGVENVGGIIGATFATFANGVVSDCINNAPTPITIIEGIDNVGGIIGCMYGAGYVSNCINNSRIRGVDCIGGIVGNTWMGILNVPPGSNTNNGQIIVLPGGTGIWGFIIGCQ